MSSSRKLIGRIEFVWQFVLISALSCLFAFLFGREPVFHLSALSKFLQALEGTVVFGVLGVYLVRAISGRLLDAGLSLRYRFPAFSVWLLACVIPIIWPKAWSFGLAFWAVLLFLGGSVPSQQRSQISVVSEGTLEGDGENIASQPVPSKIRRIEPISFLRSILTIACLWCPLILLGGLSPQEVWIWIARIGYFILSIIWLVKLLGRLEDIGWLSPSFFAYLSVGAILLFRIVRRMGRDGAIFDGAHIAFSSMPWLRFINGYGVLAVVLLIQVPLVFFPSKCGNTEPTPRQKTESRFGRILAERRRTRKRFLVRPVVFLRRLLVLVLFWLPLIYLDDMSKGGGGTWGARIGYFILVYAWMMNAQGLFEEAGLVDGWYGAQYCLVVSIVALMPLAVHWVNGYGALAIFVLIQVPTVFLKSRPKRKDPEGPSPGDTHLCSE